MSRRESRVSINVRQNDALNEFENFKKKFLLANKHITKLNSTLSVRIEELNAQISTLYVENLRLRASEIALAAQLQREREKSWRIMTDAESASNNLSKHLGHLRKTLNISHNLPSPVQQPPAPPPRARRPMPDPAATPQTTRLSRPPNIPGIYEDDEGGVSSSSEGDHMPSPTIRRKTKARLSASRLPLPARGSSSPLPSEPPPTDNDVEVKGTRKKTSRRQSGLLTVDTRPPSPAFGSPIHRDAALAQEEEEEADEEDIAITDEMNVEAELEAALRRESREKRGKTTERELEDVNEGGRRREKEKKRRRGDDEASSNTTATTESGKKLKDVTNSPNGRATLPPLDTNASERERQRTPETVPTTAVSTTPSSLLPFTSEQSTPATTPAQTPHPLSHPNPEAFLPTPRPSSSPVPPPTSASETDGGPSAPSGGRATRTRKSVNYAEPKLNTKMRKPDPDPGALTGTRKRLSSSVKPQSQPQPAADPTPQPSSEAVPPIKKRSSASTNQQTQSIPADSPEPRSSFETGPAPPKRGQSQPQEIKSRPALDSPPLQPPRPASRPAPSFRPISSSHAYVTTPATSTSSATATVKRKKSRPYVDPDDFEDSDGTQADAEYGGLTTGWVNVEGRRKSVVHGHGSTGSSKERRMDGDDGRRHSMAV